MGKRSGTCLCGLQVFLRLMELACSAIILALFAYFLATLFNHDMEIGIWVRAVAGISGIAIVYTILALLFLCCSPGQSFLSFLLSFLDIAFIAAFGYVAAVNRHGVGSCDGEVKTAFGEGDASNPRKVNEGGNGGFTLLPNLQQACLMEKASFGVAIVAAVFFAFSFMTNICLSRHRKKEQRFGPGPQNDYTSGYGRRPGFFGRRRNQPPPPMGQHDPNALPTHATPEEVRHSFATEQTRVGSSGTGTTMAGGGGGGYGNLG
ncbi:hypothetical protein QBC35DRAFT_345380, partial [Podospora australis]